jgi:hypothetical protein
MLCEVLKMRRIRVLATAAVLTLPVLPRSARATAADHTSEVLSVWASSLTQVDTVTAAPEVTAPVNRPTCTIDPTPAFSVSATVEIRRVDQVRLTRHGSLHGP